MRSYAHSHRVTYADCTIGNHIYYGRYLELLEAARGEFFRSLGKTFLEWQEQGTVFPVTECRVRYRRPAQYDDELRIELRVLAAEGARLSFGYSVTSQTGAVILEAETFHACAGLNGRPKRLPEALCASLGPDQAA